MSNFVNDALDRVRKSEFIVDNPENPRVLEIRNAVLVFTNFAGRSNKFGNCQKQFNIVVDEKTKDDLKNRKLGGLDINIHSIDPKEPGDPTLYFINVKVNMLVQFPPIVTLYTDYNGQKRKNSLDDATIGCLDRVDMKRCDVKLNVRESKTRQGWGIFYLRQFNCIQEINPDFGGAYEEYDDPLEEPNSEILEQNKDILDQQD